ncbi:host specificity factor TipJ family phage tail protein [Methylobacterium ajmalii]|uniref:Host specificity factor TipJ family phage tail protein n=1 Tax=Methylobacterium ajmalii TaxID=2738439 RepID=A0ABV0A383_9HYPH
MQIAVRHNLQLFDAEDTSRCNEAAIVLPVREASAVMGETVDAYLARVAWRFDLPTVCRINGEFYGRAEWATRHLALNDNVEFVSRPMGGGGSGGSTAKSIISIVSMIALTALAPYAVAGLGLSALGTAANSLTLLGKIASAVIVGAGALAISHFLTPKAGGKTDKKDELYSFGFGGSQVRPMQPIPVLNGRMRFAPDYGAPTYSEFNGDAMTDYALYALTCGRMRLEQILIGDTPIWDYQAGFAPEWSGIEMQFVEPGEQVTLYPVNVVTADELNGTQLSQDFTPGYIVNAAGTVAKELLLDFVWSGGAYVTYKDRTLAANTDIAVDARTVNDAGAPTSVWAPVFRKRYSQNKQSQIRVTEHISVPPGRYEVRARRENPSVEQSGIAKISGTDEVTWTALRAHIDGPNTFPRVTMLALKGVASQKLSGVSGGGVRVIGTRVLPVWRNGQFVEEPTRSIAWAALDWWRNGDYAAGLSLSNVDFAAFLAYDQLWASLGHTFDYRFTEVQNLDDVLETVLRAGRAIASPVGDKLTITRDQPRGLPRMLFTDNDIVRDSLEIDYALSDESWADGMVGEYVDETTWRLAEISSAPEGVTLLKPARVQLDGIVQRKQAAGAIRQMAAESQYRRITVSWIARMEGRLLKRGDLVKITTEEPESWGSSHEVVASANNGLSLTLDPAPDWTTSGTHWIEIRQRDGRPFGPVRVMRGATDADLTVNGSDVANAAAAASAQYGYPVSLADAVSRSDSQEPPWVAFSPGEPRSFPVLITSGDPDQDGEHIHLSGVLDAPEVYATTETGVPPLLQVPDLYSEAMPVITFLTASISQRQATLVLNAGWLPARNAVTYDWALSYDGGATWVSAPSTDRTAVEAVVGSSDAMLFRVRGVTLGGQPGGWSIASVIAPPLVIQGELVDITTLPPITYNNLDAVISDRIKSVDGIKARAEEAYNGALGALGRANDARTAADGAQANAVAALGRAAGAQTDATKALADAQTAFQAAVDRSALALSTALARLDQLRRGLAVDPTVRQGYIDPLVTDVRSDLEILMRNATRNMQDIAGLRDALTTAGLEIIPSEGRVRFYAVEALQTSVGQTISNFSVTVDALSRKIDLYGSVQGNDLQGLINSINVVQTTLDAQAATISSLATSAQFTALGARLSTAELTISAQGAAITARATQTSVDAQGVRISAAEQRISASEGRISQQILATQSAGIDADLLPRTLAGFLDLVGRQQGALSQSLALVNDAISANVDAAGRATAEVRTELLVYQGDAAAQFLSVTRAVADTNSALVETRTSLLARIGAADAAITTEATARAAADAATTSQLTSAVSRIGAAEAGLITEQQTRATADAASTSRIDGAISRITASEGRIGTAEAAIVEERRTRADADAASTSRIDAAVSRITSTEGRIGTAEASIATEARTRADADAASTSRIDGAVSRITATEGRIGTAEATLVAEAKTRADADAATTSRVDGAISRITATEGRIGTAEAAIATEARTRADADAATTSSITTAVSRITAAEGRIGGTEASLITEAKTRADADGAQTSALAAAVSRIGSAEANLVTEATTRASADAATTLRVDGAISRITATEGRIGSAEASLTTEAKTRADADAAQTSSINAAVSRIASTEGRIGTAEASLVSEAKTRADADAAQTSAITAAQSRLGSAEAAIASEAKTRSDADAATTSRVDAAVSRIGGVEGRVGSTEASIASEAQTRADQTGALSSRVDGLSGRMGAAEANIITVAQARADGDGALSSRIDQVNARAGAIEGSVTSEAQARAGADGALSSRLDQVSARAEAANAGVANEATARASQDGAFAIQINDLYARSDQGTAYGRFSMDVQSAPSGVSVRLAARASTESYGQRRNAGWFLDLLPDGNSRFVIDANFFAITANGGTSYPFQFDGSTLTIPNLRVSNSAILPGAVSQSDWHFSGGNSYLEFTVNCRPNSRLSIFAMFDGVPTTGININSTGKLQIYRDGILLRETPISFYVAGNNQNLAAYTLNTMTFVRDTPGGGAHTYRIQNSSGQAPVSCTWQELAA